MLYRPLECRMDSRSWKGCPLMGMAMGSKERIVDGGKVVAQLAARQGVPIVWDEYELMPHNWPMVFPDHPHSIKCYYSWVEAFSPFVEGTPVTAKALFTELKSQDIWSLDVQNLTHLTAEEVESLMRDKQKTIRPFTGRPAAKSLL